jgi:hypothetical protein
MKDRAAPIPVIVCRLAHKHRAPAIAPCRSCTQRALSNPFHLASTRLHARGHGASAASGGLHAKVTLGAMTLGGVVVVRRQLKTHPAQQWQPGHKRRRESDDADQVPVAYVVRFPVARVLIELLAAHGPFPLFAIQGTPSPSLCSSTIFLDPTRSVNVSLTRYFDPRFAHAGTCVRKIADRRVGRRCQYRKALGK